MPSGVRRKDADGRPVDSLGRHRYPIAIDTEREYDPAAERARRERVTMQWVVQSLTRAYGAGLVDLGPPSPGAVGRASRPYVQTRQFWLHRDAEHDAAQRRALDRDGVGFSTAVRRLLRAYGEGQIDLHVVVVDKRGEGAARHCQYRAGMDSIEFAAAGISVNGLRLLDLVRQAELPFAIQEMRERPEAFGPEDGPEELAGAYTDLLPNYYWPSRHFLGEPRDEPLGIREDGETMLLTCSGCGMAECWSFLARVEVTETTVRWSGFRNSHSDWDLSALGPFVFSRPQYEQALRRTEAAH
ncbi:hypothetical protein [Actinomadura sp. GTD37]|uniref:hypothetical protein n=1 Tax=Actinomadura sp. GTD37 TaxID=1778030 RepID=UPI0035C0976A